MFRPFTKALLRSHPQKELIDMPTSDHSIPPEFPSTIVFNIIPKSSTKKVFWALLPSFFASKPFKIDHGGISALDGLRGMACLFVVNEHFTCNFSTFFQHEFGFGGERWVLQLPFIRVMFSGLAMVAIFFVISGYVLTYKTFKQIHRRDFAGAHTTLASSTFRRALRLYLPTWTMIFLCAFAAWLGIWRQADKQWSVDHNEIHICEGPALQFKHLTSQMADASYYAWRLLDVFSFTDGQLHAEHYDKHTWTIAVEFRSSMVLFMSMLAVSHTRPAWRIVVLSCLTMTLMSYGQRNMSLFIAGAILADMDQHIRHIQQQTQQQGDLVRGGTMSLWNKFISRWLHPNSNVYPSLFVLGMYFLSAPMFGPDRDPFYAITMRLIPFQSIMEPLRWSRIYGAVLVVWAVANSTLLNPLFVNPVSTYLGRISFAMYLIHGDLIRCLLPAMNPVIYSLTGDGTWKNQTAGQMVFSWFLAAIIFAPIAVCLSDLFWRFVDQPFTNLARRIEAYVYDDDERLEKSALL